MYRGSMFLGTFKLRLRQQCAHPLVLEGDYLLAIMKIRLPVNMMLLCGSSGAEAMGIYAHPLSYAHCEVGTRGPEDVVRGSPIVLGRS